MPDFPDRPGYSFNPGPPPEASRFLRNKGLRPAFSFWDVEPEEHAVAFTVAKATDTQVLQSIRDAVQTALGEGQTFETFKKQLRPELERQGWWGRKDMVDPVTGEVVRAQLGSPRRLRTIYRANLRSARAAGQWERIERTSETMPYLQYRIGPSERHRPEHEAKDGMILPHDDPFWARWYPPNGWGCRCWVRQLSARQAGELGISERPEVPEIERVNRRTGEVRRVPVGIDPGWDRNPGRMRMQAMQDYLRKEILAADPEVSAAALRDTASSWMVRRIADGMKGEVPIARLPAAIAKKADMPEAVVFNDRTARHLFKEKDDRKFAELSEVGLVQRAEKFAVSTDIKGRRALHVLVEEASNPDANTRRDRRPVVATMFLDGDRLVLTTTFRADPRKWVNRVRRLGWRQLWEE